MLADTSICPSFEYRQRSSPQTGTAFQLVTSLTACDGRYRSDPKSSSPWTRARAAGRPSPADLSVVVFVGATTTRRDLIDRRLPLLVDADYAKEAQTAEPQAPPVLVEG